MIKLIAFDLTKASEAKMIVEYILKYYPQSAYPPSVEMLMQTKNKYFKAYYNDQLVGMTGYDLKTPTLVETVKTIIFSEFRGQNLGKKLSMAIEEECKKIGIKKIMTTIYANNIAMIQIKLKQGYVIEGYHPDHEAPGFHEYSLGKVLR